MTVRRPTVKLFHYTDTRFVADNKHPLFDPVFWRPRYWPTWLLFVLMWSLARLPYGWQMGLGRLAGRLLAWLPSRRRHIAAVNLALCFPELDARQRTRLLRQHLVSLGVSLVETAISWWAPPDRLQRRIHIEGLEHYRDAAAKGHGVILLVGHFVHMELIGRLLATRLPLHITYRVNKNALYDRMLRRVHASHCRSLIAHTNIRAMLQVLKDNEALWYAPDQNYAGKHSTFVPFFGRLAATITATSRIAAHSGARLIVVQPERLADNRGYRIVLSPPLAEFPGDSPGSDAARIMAMLEAHIRTVPEQYLWVHRRFKTRPEGEPPVY